MNIILLLAVTLAWDANVDTVNGYKLHYGPTQGSPSQHQDVGNVTTYTVDNATLPIGSAIYFSVTAYNATSESGPSNEVVYVVPTPGTGATFVREDVTTQGSWKGVYGANGRAITGDSRVFPAWATVSFTALAQYIYVPSTTDVRAIQKLASTTDRIASTWYGEGSADVNFSDSNSHQVAVYFLDWGNLGRSQRVDVVDAVTDQVLDTRTISGFQDGKWLVWNISGNVKIKVTKITGANAVLSGLFL